MNRSWRQLRNCLWRLDSSFRAVGLFRKRLLHHMVDCWTAIKCHRPRGGDDWLSAAISSDFAAPAHCLVCRASYWGRSESRSSVCRRSTNASSVPPESASSCSRIACSSSRIGFFVIVIISAEEFGRRADQQMSRRKRYPSNVLSPTNTLTDRNDPTTGTARSKWADWPNRRSQYLPFRWQCGDGPPASLSRNGSGTTTTVGQCCRIKHRCTRCEWPAAVWSWLGR